MDQAEQKALVGVPKIIYASRTHSQLNQAVQELKRSAYSSLKSVTIGGRDQLCIDDEVNLEVGNGNKMHGCKKKVDAKNCTFHSGVEGARNHALIKQANVLDIEDLVKIGKQHRCCPYFLSKHLMQTSDIIFMPYNYILDPQLRKANQVELENSVIILDEGHNVEKLCEESASIQICSSDIILASDDVNHIIQQLTDDKTLLGRNSMEKDFTIADCELVRDILLKLEKVVEDIPVQFSSGEATFDGGHIFTLLQQANVKYSKFYLMILMILFFFYR